MKISSMKQNQCKNFIFLLILNLDMTKLFLQGVF